MSNLVTTPKAFRLRASDKLCFGLTQDDTGSGTVVKQGIYQLKCVDTGEFLMKEPSMFRGGKEVCFDLMDLVACQLRTTVPQINQLGIFEDPTFKKSVQLCYGTAIQNLENCEANKCKLSEVSGEYEIVNSYCEQYFTDLIGDGEILSNNPINNVLCEGSCDWLWVCGEANITIKIMDSTGAIAFQNYATPKGVHYFGVGPANVELGNGPATAAIDRDKIICIEIFRDGVPETKITVMKCCCDCGDELFFLDPKGSIRNFGHFECIETKGMDVQGSKICRQSSCKISEKDLAAYYGARFLRKGGFERLSFKKSICVDCENENFFKAFSNASAYWIKRNGVLVSFYPESRPQNYRIDDGLTEISFSGHISLQSPSHKIN